MAFYEPFDDVQFAAALKTHRQMRTNLRTLRRQFPPTTSETRRLLKHYRDLIQEFGRQLAGTRGKINPRRLNELSEKAVTAFVDYARRSD